MRRGEGGGRVSNKVEAITIITSCSPCLFRRNGSILLSLLAQNETHFLPFAHTLYFFDKYSNKSENIRQRGSGRIQNES